MTRLPQDHTRDSAKESLDELVTNAHAYRSGFEVKELFAFVRFLGLYPAVRTPCAIRSCAGSALESASNRAMREIVPPPLAEFT
ncbi:MAG TPA: hypothetical protein PK648_13370 [Verrucomicrobiales bacterium]|nr:hypothetical protein [Verrucomicrobiales bacterium]